MAITSRHLVYWRSSFLSFVIFQNEYHSELYELNYFYLGYLVLVLPMSGFLGYFVYLAFFGYFVYLGYLVLVLPMSGFLGYFVYLAFFGYFVYLGYFGYFVLPLSGFLGYFGFRQF